MPFHRRVPDALNRGPFTAADALAAGLERWHLDTSSYRRVGRDVYVWAGLPDTPELKLAAAQLHLPVSFVFSGRTAAWVHDLDSKLAEPIEITLPPRHGIKARVGLRISRVRLAPNEMVIRRGWRVTSPIRTILDLSRRLPLVEAVTLADAALHRRLTSLGELQEASDDAHGTRNVQRIRRLLQHVEPRSESHMESVLRMVLVTAGLPRPEAQVELQDARGQFIARADLYYPSHRLAIEYDGGTHRESLVDDNRRQNRILAAGYKLRRYTAPDVLGNSHRVVAEIRGELLSPPGFGWRAGR